MTVRKCSIETRNWWIETRNCMLQRLRSRAQKAWPPTLYRTPMENMYVCVLSFSHPRSFEKPWATHFWILHFWDIEWGDSNGFKLSRRSLHHCSHHGGEHPWLRGSSHSSCGLHGRPFSVAPVARLTAMVYWCLLVDIWVYGGFLK